MQKLMKLIIIKIEYIRLIKKSINIILSYTKNFIKYVVKFLKKLFFKNQRIQKNF